VGQFESGGRRASRRALRAMGIARRTASIAMKTIKNPVAPTTVRTSVTGPRGTRPRSKSTKPPARIQHRCLNTEGMPRSSHGSRRPNRAIAGVAPGVEPRPIRSVPLPGFKLTHYPRPLESRTSWCKHSYVTQVYVSPYRGAGADWQRCDFCDRTPVVVFARRDGAFGSALFCADCEPKVREGDHKVVAKVPSGRP
jgi:hypothetical protein